jgi:hypothetical protein
MVKQKQIGDLAFPQEGFGLGTPEGAEGGGASCRVTPGNMGQERAARKGASNCAPDQQ